MTIVKILAFVLGLALVGLALSSALRVVVLPRAAVDPIARVVFRVNYVIFRGLAERRSTYEARDRVMALFAPISLLMMPVAWLTVVTFGYMFMFWGAGVDLWRDTFSVSGSSLLTLGFTPVEGVPQTVLAFTEATIGLGLIALLITYLPSMYGAFRRREEGVALLEVRAGSPPTGVEMLDRFHRIAGLMDLAAVYREWEAWFVDVEESHTTAPSLVFFRSPHAERSWITAAGAVLDGGALLTSSVNQEVNPQVPITIRAGFLSLRRIADVFGIVYDADPAPTDPISVTRSEFDEAYERLAAAGLPMQPDRDQAWRDFVGWRVNYDTVLLALCSMTLAPYAPWSSDRSRSVSGKAAGLSRFGLYPRRRRRDDAA